QIWMSHGDSVSKLPKGFFAIGKTLDCPVAAMESEKGKIYGLQFHPEVAHTKDGPIILKNFVFKICRAKKDWSLELYFRQIVTDIKKTVGRKKVFMLVSGGVDSTVCFAVLEKVLGKKRVFGLHVDNGFARLNESQEVAKALAKAGFDDLVIYDAAGRFLKALKGVTDPEKKREIIGRQFLKVKDLIMAEAKLNPFDWVLGQGTIYPDTIETGASKHADKIKTHHNRVKEVLKLMKLGRLLEPLAGLYKDEVRQLGKKLKLPASLIDRHPFPGPGLAVRTLCGNGQELKSSRAQELKLKKIVGKNLQAAILPLKSVGVQGDNRTYRHPAIISGPAGWAKLHDLSVRITNELTEVNRVVYLVNPRKIDFSQLKIKKAYLAKDRLDNLRRADYLVTAEIKKQKITKPKIPKKELVKAIGSGAFASTLCGFLPGMGAAQAAIVASSVFKRIKTETFLILVGAVGTMVMVISFIA
ncbi:hypothetical protein HYZ76_01270, partial [Candidatus Falkowbacteria bacterium]|nr:hypothetical protein [Candidatus Falkowbacteria bacterium]